MRARLHLVRLWALDLAAAAVLVLLLVCMVPFGPQWLVLTLQDLEYDGALYLLRPAMLALFLTAWMFARGVRRLATGPLAGRLRTQTRMLLRDENGALVLEFALIFPFIMALVFILFQWAEVLMADGLVHYASFCAARTAATYASAINRPQDQQGDGRFELGNDKRTAMKRSATLALNGAFALEGEARHQDVVVDVTMSSNGGQLVAGNETSTRRPDRRNGGYKYVHVSVKWGFCPRWPMAFLFFRPMITNKRIQMEGQYVMQVDGYYRSPTLNEDSQDSDMKPSGDHYNAATSMEDPKKREGLIQKALYRTVLKESHGASGAVSGNRQKLASGCKNQ